MTPLELWQAGGPEPIVVAELPCEPAFLPPWKWKSWQWCAIGRPGHEAPPDVEDRETENAAEECRAALAAALFGGGWRYRGEPEHGVTVEVAVEHCVLGRQVERAVRGFGYWKFENGTLFNDFDPSPIARAYAWRTLLPAPPVEDPCEP